MEEQERGKEETEMPGPRQKLSVLEANGRKHLSKAEKAARAAREVELPKPAKMRVPRWLPEHLKADFRALAKELLAADMGAAQLDRDTVGRYLVAQHQFTAACRMVQDALDHEDPDLVNKWQRPGAHHHQPVPPGGAGDEETGGEPVPPADGGETACLSC